MVKWKNGEMVKWKMVKWGTGEWKREKEKGERGKEKGKKGKEEKKKRTKMKGKAQKGHYPSSLKDHPRTPTKPYPQRRLLTYMLRCETAINRELLLIRRTGFRHALRAYSPCYLGMTTCFFVFPLI